MAKQAQAHPPVRSRVHGKSSPRQEDNTAPKKTKGDKPSAKKVKQEKLKNSSKKMVKDTKDIKKEKNDKREKTPKAEKEEKAANKKEKKEKGVPKKKAEAEEKGGRTSSAGSRPSALRKPAAKPKTSKEDERKGGNAVSIKGMEALKKKMEERRKEEEHEEDESSDSDSIAADLNKVLNLRVPRSYDSEDEDDGDDGDDGESSSCEEESVEDENSDAESEGSGASNEDAEEDLEEDEDEKEETDEKGDKSMALVPVKRNSVTNKRDWDTFCRRIQDRKNFPCELAGYLAKSKVDLFNAWLDGNKQWDQCRLIVTRTHSNENQSLSGWVAKPGREIVKEFGEDKGRTVMKKREQQGLCYDNDDFPGDEMERFYYMKKPKELTRKQCVSDQSQIQAKNELDEQMLQALTDENDGVMRQGALPDAQASSAAGQKLLFEGLAEAVAAVPKKKKEKKEESSEPALPKTNPQKAEDLMVEILAESVAARRKSMGLGAVNYAGELSAQLLAHAEKLEKHYKTLQQAVSTRVDDDGFYAKAFKKVEELRHWYKTAEAWFSKQVDLNAFQIQFSYMGSLIAYIN